MKLHQVKELLEAEVICGEELLDLTISSGFGCDLISDSLSFSRPDCLLLTGLTNIQIIRVAEMVEAKAIIFVRGKIPGTEIIEISRKRNIPLMITKRFLFESCGILYQHGLRSF